MKRNPHLKTEHIRAGITIVMSLCAFIGLWSQSFPDPLYTFPLNANNPASWSGQDGTQHLGGATGSFEAFQDRFGNASGAVKFMTQHSAIVQGNDVPAIGADTPVTVSFWTYLENLYSYPQGSSPYDKEHMTKLRFFSLSTDYKSGGMARVSENALLGVERKVTNSTTTNPWYLWFYEPAILDVQGWYQIIAIFDPYFTKVYVYKPDGSNVCSYTYMGNAFEKRLAIGKKDNYPNEHVSGAMIIDDFKVWNSALTKEQADAVNSAESILNTPVTTALEGDYFLIDSENRCLDTAPDGIHWNAFTDSGGNKNYGACSKIEVHQENPDQNAYTLHTKNGYLGPNGPLTSAAFRNQQYSTHTLNTNDSKTVLELFDVSNDTQGTLQAVALRDNESLSLSYHLKDIGTIPASQIPHLPPSEQHSDLNADTEIAISVTILTLAAFVAGAYAYKRGFCFRCKMVKRRFRFNRGRRYRSVNTQEEEVETRETSFCNY